MVKTKLKNSELQIIYDHIKNRDSPTELSEALNRTRTNTYYYIGRAVHYWIKTGVLRFKKVNLEPSELGGQDCPIKEGE